MMSEFFDPSECEETVSESAVIHATSCVDLPCRIGDRTTVLHFSHIMPHSIIGSDCLIGQHVTVGSGVLIGNHAKVMNNALLISGVIMEDEVYCGPSTVFVQLNRMRGKQSSVSRVTPTIVRKGASIGPNTTVAAGTIIGQHSFIEAGSVVDRTVPNFAYMSGNPIRFAGWRCMCGQALPSFKGKQQQTQCQQCQKQYLLTHPLRLEWKPAPHDVDIDTSFGLRQSG